MFKRVWLGAMAIALLIPAVLNADPLKLNVRASVDGIYSDNVFMDVADEQSDYYARVLPAVEGGWRTERAEFFLSGHPEFYFYSENKELDAIDQSYDGRLNYRWSERLSTSLTAAYLDDERPERELAETGLLFSDNRRRRQTYSFGGQYALSEAAVAALSYSYQDETFEDPQTYDFEAHSVSLRLSRNLAPLLERTSGRLQAGFALYDYSRKYAFGNIFQVVEIDDRQSIENYSLTLGLDRAMAEQLRLGIDLGARCSRNESEVRQHVESIFAEGDLPPRQDKNTSRGFVGTLEAVYTGEKSKISALLSHDLVPASGRNGLAERTTVRLADDVRLTEHLYLNLMARVYRNRTDESRITLDIHEITMQVQAGVRYAFNSWWSMGAYWRGTWIDDRQADEDREQNQVSVRLSWNWPVLE